MLIRPRRQAAAKRIARGPYGLLIFHHMKRKPICGAMTRLGRPCQRKLLLRGRKCPNHGGRSSGPTSIEGRAKAISAMHDVRHSPEGRQAHSELLRSLWADPGFRLRITKTKAARAGKKDQAFVLAARFDIQELDRRAEWARKRRAKRLTRIRVLEEAVLAERIAIDLGFARPR